jgi:uncharacterized protein
MAEKIYKADVVIAGGGIAGIIAALELLDYGKKVILIDRDEEKEFGGLANWAFGGMFFVDSPHQRRAGIRDNTDLALRDWFSFAEFGEKDHWPKKWAEQFIHLCTNEGYRWLRSKGVNFFPVVHWVERGLLQPGNSVPRFHMLWGSGYELAQVMIRALKNHKKAADLLQLFFRHRVMDIVAEGGAIHGVRGTDESTGEEFRAEADVVVVATGGINGSIERLKENWYKPWGAPPEVILNGSHQYGIGDLHDAAEKVNGNVTHLDWQWNYAAGVHHPKPHFEGHGLSLVPCKSAIWTNYRGERFGPMPLITAYDTRYLVERICQEEKKYSWQILNLKIANKEFAISGSEHNPALKNKQLLRFLLTILTGNKKLVREMLDTCPDFVTARSVEELAEKMNVLTGDGDVDPHLLRESIENYDAHIDRGRSFHNDEQLRRIAHCRQYRGDRVRTSNFQKINDPKAMPLIAIREFILSRKTLGGIQTDLESRVMTKPRKGKAGAYPRPLCRRRSGRIRRRRHARPAGPGRDFPLRLRDHRQSGGEVDCGEGRDDGLMC